MKTITIDNRPVPLSRVEDYVRLLRGRVRGGVQAYEWERSRLHNAIFNAAGLPDKEGGSARQVAYSSRYTIDNREYVEFENALDDVLCDVLGCPDGHGTLRRDLVCYQCGKKVTLQDNLRTLHKMADKKGK